MGARAIGPWVGEQKPLGKTPCGATPVPSGPTYLPLWAKAEGIEPHTRLDLLRRTWKPSIWSENDEEEVTMPYPEVPLGYSLYYAQQGRQDSEDELPPETMGRRKKQQKGRATSMLRRISLTNWRA